MLSPDTQALDNSQKVTLTSSFQGTSAQSERVRKVSFFTAFLLSLGCSMGGVPKAATNAIKNISPAAATALEGIGPKLAAADGMRMQEAKMLWTSATRRRNLEGQIRALSSITKHKTPEALEFILKAISKKGKNSHALRNLAFHSLREHYVLDSKFNKQLSKAFLQGGVLSGQEHAHFGLAVFVAWVQHLKDDLVYNLLPKLNSNPYIQSAAYKSLKFDSETLKPEFLNKALDQLPNKQPERSVVLGSILFMANKRIPTKEYKKYDPILRKIALELDNPNVTPLCKHEISYLLATVLGSNTLFDTSKSWLEFMDKDERAVIERLKADGYAVPKTKTTFLGLTAHSKSMVFVFDTSDSMEEPAYIDKASYNPENNAPTTGKDAEDIKQKRKQKLLETFPGLKKEDLDSIKTKFDACKAVLRNCLRELSENQYFSVIVFNGEVRQFRSTKKLMRATKRNVEKAIKELDGVKSGGTTNLVDAMELAFAVTHEKTEKVNLGINPNCINHSADSIFLLSDGYPGLNKYVKNTDQALFKTFFINLAICSDHFYWQSAFRPTRIHSIGIPGGATNNFGLKYLASSHGGKFHHLGKKE